MACAAPWNPMARPRERPGTTRVMMARLLACSMAAPTAWRARKTHSAPRLGSQAAQRRGDDEDHEAVDVEELAAPHVGEAADRGDGGHQHHQVAEPHPGHRAHAGVERLLQGGQGHRHDAGVQLAHEGPDAHGGHGEPGRTGVLPDGPGAAGLGKQEVAHPSTLADR